MTTMQIKQHDLEPDLVLVVEDLDRRADLGAVAAWRIIGKLRGVVVVDEVLAPGSVVVDPVDTWKATLTRAWVAGETDTAGDMRIEAEAMWPGDRPQTFPSASSETVRINPDLG